MRIFRTEDNHWFVIPSRRSDRLSLTEVDDPRLRNAVVQSTYSGLMGVLVEGDLDDVCFVVDYLEALNRTSRHDSH